MGGGGQPGRRSRWYRSSLKIKGMLKVFLTFFFFFFLMLDFFFLIVGNVEGMRGVGRFC